MKIIQGLKDFRLLNHNLYKLSTEEIKKYQETQLKELVHYAAQKSPYYKKSFADRAESDFLSSYQKLPTISKQIMMDNFDEINTCGLRRDEVLDFAINQEFSGNYAGYYLDKYVVGLSSGTSGNKGIYVTPREMTERLPFVFLARGGIPLNYLPFRILFLLRVFSQGFEDINGPLIKLNYKSTMTPPEELIMLINSNKINIIMAPPSMLRILMGRADKISVKIKMILSYAEVLEEEEKQRIKAAFKAEVHEIYQASEGQLGSTCRCGNLHINEDLVFVELYDKEGKAVDKPGAAADSMLVTNLVNRVQPLIRYEMNDLIVLGDKCPCGSAFRVIKKILGRHDDVLYLTDSSGSLKPVFPDLFARWIITTDDRIREFKVVQLTDQRLEIMIDISKNAAQNEEISLEEVITDKLKNRITRELGNYNIRCQIKITSGSIKLPETMSKYKRFESITANML